MKDDLQIIQNLQELLNVTLEQGQFSQLGELNQPQTKFYEISEDGHVVGLNLSQMSLHEIPWPVFDLPQLNTLWLCGNNIREIPPDIVRLSGLRQLYVTGNRIKKLQRELTGLSKLRSLRVKSNPLEQPPPEIIKQGLASTLEYLRQLPTGPTTVVNEAKLIIVGQGDVGKTCLAKRMIYDTFQHERSTEGIDIHRWPLIAPTDTMDEITLNVWDFGGQEIYHATHQFFLTKRSVYLVVWNARKSRDYEHIYYWLHTVEAFGEDSPILLVMSKLGERDDDLNMKDIREKFPAVIGLLKVDSEVGTGIQALTESIANTSWHLPHMRTPWIEPWFAVREQLESDDRSWISHREFCKICRQHKLDDKQTSILDEYLHDLGAIIHFRDRIELRDMVILKPEWATDAVYAVIDWRPVLERGGELLHAELPDIWDAEVYPPDVYTSLLELMNRFELAYRLPDSQSHLVAELLPRTPPDFSWSQENNLRFYYKYDFLPAGVITRFIVRAHEDIEKTPTGIQLCWREGCVLSVDETRALIKVRAEVKVIEITITGPAKRELLAIVRQHFEHINSSIRKVTVSKHIPCICSSKCTHWFNFDQLQRAERLKRNEVDCPVSWERVSLSRLLDGYERKKEETMSNETNRPQINISNTVNQTQSNVQKAEQRQESVQIGNFRLDEQLPALQEELEELWEVVLESDTEVRDSLRSISNRLDDLSPASKQQQFLNPINKLGRFLRKAVSDDSPILKGLKRSKHVLQQLGRVGKRYNQFAQWLGLPQVPGVFTKD